MKEYENVKKMKRKKKRENICEKHDKMLFLTSVSPVPHCQFAAILCVALFNPGFQGTWCSLIYCHGCLWGQPPSDTNNETRKAAVYEARAYVSPLLIDFSWRDYNLKPVSKLFFSYRCQV